MRQTLRDALAGEPRPVLSLQDGIALVLGIVIGVGIFRAPPSVAASVSAELPFLATWLAGGVVSLAGAMCYAELASAYPDPGGDYHFLLRALGRPVAFLFAWARLTVIPTGSVAMLGFAFGDYVSSAAGVPAASAPLAGAMVAAVTAMNASGLRVARGVQRFLTAALVLVIVLVIIAGFAVPPARAAAAGPPRGGPGLAMVFVLLAYGGWNEAAYVSTELRGGRRRIAVVLVVSLALISALYLLANAAYVRALGLGGVRASEAVAADVLARWMGPAGALAVAAVFAASAVASANATLLMGSRLVWAFGRDFPVFEALGRWSTRAGSPVNAVLAQGGMALALVGVGAAWRAGFEAMVAYVAPVFWGFFLLSGVSLFVLRRRDPGALRPFRVPLYPVTPAVFCATCAFLLWSSLVHAGRGAWLGLAVLATGLVPLRATRRHPISRRV
ncbi:MAG TPA: amino acid permease [Anaeromyxobacter sp.]|nr:amino acid permease [Anaeromyxobacter sp.]